MIKVKCDDGKTKAEITNGSLFECCCVIATIIDAMRKNGTDDEMIKLGIETALGMENKENKEKENE